MVHHFYVVGAKSNFVSSKPDVIFHIAWPHGKGNFVVIQLFLHGADDAFTGVIKNIVYGNIV